LYASFLDKEMTLQSTENNACVTRINVEDFPFVYTVYFCALYGSDTGYLKTLICWSV
jgi:hypothetical protein